MNWFDDKKFLDYLRCNRFFDPKWIFITAYEVSSMDIKLKHIFRSTHDHYYDWYEEEYQEVLKYNQINSIISGNDYCENRKNYNNNTIKSYDRKLEDEYSKYIKNWNNQERREIISERLRPSRERSYRIRHYEYEKEQNKAISFFIKHGFYLSKKTYTEKVEKKKKRKKCGLEKKVSKTKYEYIKKEKYVLKYDHKDQENNINFIHEKLGLMYDEYSFVDCVEKHKKITREFYRDYKYKIDCIKNSAKWLEAEKCKKTKMVSSFLKMVSGLQQQEQGQNQ